MTPASAPGRRPGLTFALLLMTLLSACAPDEAPSPAAADAARLARAYEQRTSDILVSGEGVVTRILSDDARGSRHQRFLVELETGQTVLVAHNIDVAPRVAGLERGDRVAFRGEYEWNEQGGVIHWTHRDAAGHHAPGWVEHRGRRYD